MAYQTGTATNPHDLIEAYKLFIEVDGWIINAFEFDVSYPQGWWLSVEKDTIFANILSSDTDIFIRGTDAYTVGGGYSGQGGTTWFTDWCQTNYLTSTMVKYWFFSGPTYAHAIVEISPSYFAHFGIGKLEKAGNYIGGEYYYGTFWYPSDPDNIDNYYHHFPFDSRGYVGTSNYHRQAGGIRFMEGHDSYNNWGLFGHSLLSGHCSGGYPRGAAIYGDLVSEGAIASFNLSTTLHPLVSSCLRTDLGASILGQPFDIRYIDMTYFDPASVNAIGADEWLVFPIKCKTFINTTTPYSGRYGLAYRKNI